MTQPVQRECEHPWYERKENPTAKAAEKLEVIKGLGRKPGKAEKSPRDFSLMEEPGPEKGAQAARWLR